MFRWCEAPAHPQTGQNHGTNQSDPQHPCQLSTRTSPGVPAASPPCVLCRGTARAGQQGWHSPEGAASERIRKHQCGPGCPPHQSHCSLTACHIFNFLCLCCWIALDCSSICCGPWHSHSPFAGSFLTALTAPQPAAKQSGEHGWGFRLSVSLMPSLKTSFTSTTRHGRVSQQAPGRERLSSSDPTS